VGQGLKLGLNSQDEGVRFQSRHRDRVADSTGRGPAAKIARAVARSAALHSPSAGAWASLVMEVLASLAATEEVRVH
jgi:hypothetical protein